MDSEHKELQEESHLRDTTILIPWLNCRVQ